MVARYRTTTNVGEHVNQAELEFILMSLACEISFP